MRCNSHPDVVTARSCAVCGRSFCDACLGPTALGPACEGCAPAVDVATPESMQQPSRAERARRGLMLTGELLYWGLVATPLVLGALSLLDMNTLLTRLDFIHKEPLRLGDVAADLVDLTAFAEQEQARQGIAWDGEAWMSEVERRPDPYNIEGAPYQVLPAETGMYLCSVGPDRTLNGGAPMDRFTGTGDVCMLLRSPAMLQVR